MDVGKRHGHPRRVPCRDVGGRQGGAADQQVGPPEERRKPLREVVTPPVEAPSKPVRKDGPEKGGGVFTLARPPQRQRWRKGKGNPRRPRGHVRVDEATGQKLKTGQTRQDRRDRQCKEAQGGGGRTVRGMQGRKNVEGLR